MLTTHASPSPRMYSRAAATRSRAQTYSLGVTDILLCSFPAGVPAVLCGMGAAVIAAAGVHRGGRGDARRPVVALAAVRSRRRVWRWVRGRQDDALGIMTLSSFPLYADQIGRASCRER